MERINKKIVGMLGKKVTIDQWMMVFLGVIFLRTLTEQFFAKTSKIAPYEIILEFIHNFLFFSIAFASLWILHSLIMKKNPEELSFVFLCASFLVLCPPLIDMIKTGGETYWSFYTLGSLSDLKGIFLSLMGNLPSGVTYFGTRITFFSAIVLLAGFVFVTTRSCAKTIFSAFVSYSVFFLMGSFPSLFTAVYYKLAENKPFSDIQGFSAVQLFGGVEKIWGIDFRSLRFSFVYKLDFIFFLILIFLLSVLFWLIDKKKMAAMAKNARYPQLVYNAGLLFVGMGLGISQYPGNLSFGLFGMLMVLVLLASVWLAWLASVVPNDINDRKADEISNPGRPLPEKMFTEKEYIGIGMLMFFLSLLGGMIVGLEFFFLLLAYQILAWFYSSSPFRLKRYLGLASFLSALASLMVFFMGFALVADGQNIHGIPIRIIWLLLIAYSLSIPIKDLKDIKGDAKDGIFTIPVVFGEKRGRLIIGANIFISFVLSVFVFNEMRLFLWAVLFGSISFLILQKRYIHPRKVFWWILPLVAFYGLLIVSVVFLK